MKNFPPPEAVAKYHGFMRQWQQKLNLQDWRFIFSSRVAKGAMSDMSSVYADRTATYRLGNFDGSPMTDHELESTACHEALHTLLDELIEVVKASASEDIQMAAQHRIINTLERLLVPPPL